MGPVATAGGRGQAAAQGGLHSRARPQVFFLARAGHRRYSRAVGGSRDPVRLESRPPEDGHRRPERGDPLHVRDRVAGGVWHCPGRLREQLEVSVPRRHPLQRADDLI